MFDNMAMNKDAANDIDHDIAAKNKKALEFIDRASNTGNIELLYHSLDLHPEILDEIDKKRFIDTPLHKAAKMGRQLYCAEMMNLMPSFGKKLNSEGYSPLHLALRHWEYGTALTLVRIDKELVRVKGRDGITPLMYCAQSSEYNDTLAMFLRDCPQAIFDESTRYETALHVALKNGNCDGAVMILNWLKRSSKERILQWKDDEGNTPLHLATKYRCIEAMKILMDNTRLNARNHANMTPLDIANDEQTIKLLEAKNAKKSTKLVRKLTYAEFLKSPMTHCERAIKTYTTMMKELDADMRNVVLVVAVLIATATYTAVLQPPGGLYQVSADDDTTSTNLVFSTWAGAATDRVGKMANAGYNGELRKANAGKMVMTESDYKRFMPTNTLAFVLAVVVIIFVLPGRPYTFALHLSLIALSYSCLIAMHYVSLENSRTADVSFFVGWTLLALATVVKVAFYLLVKGFWWEVWWAPHYYDKATNFAEGFLSRGGQRDMSRMSKFRKQYRLTVGTLNQQNP